MKNKKGLTLIELLAVIAIIAILFVLLIPQINNAIDKARTSGVQTDLRSYQTAINSALMKSEINGIGQKEINELLDGDLKFLGMISKKKNPWGKEYILSIQENKIEVMTNSKKEELYKIRFSTDENGEIKNETIGMDKKVIEKAQEDLIGYCKDRDVSIEDNPDDFKYIEVTGGLEITEYIGNEIDIVIPCQIDGKNVISIRHEMEDSGRGVFSYKLIEKIVLPNTLRKIGAHAFTGNKLKELKIPDSVITIEHSAFYGNPIEKLELGKNLEKISSNVFSKTNIKHKLTIPEKVSYIGYWAFQDSGITEVEIMTKEKITIGFNAFILNPNLTKVGIHSNSVGYCDELYDNKCISDNSLLAFPIIAK